MEDAVTPEVVDPKEQTEPSVDTFVQETMDGSRVGVVPPKPAAMHGARAPKSAKWNMMRKEIEEKKVRFAGLSEEELGELLEQNGGFYSIISKKIGVSVDAISKRVMKSEYLTGIEKNIKAGMTDLAVNELTKAMKRGEAWAITFYLKCKGGWNENPKFQVGDGSARKAITFNIIPQSKIVDVKRTKEIIEGGEEDAGTID